MTQTVEVLILDLLEWLSTKDRSYEETMDAWRTSCPKLPVWEDANDLGLLYVENRSGGRSSVRLTRAGSELLRNKGRRHDGLAGSYREAGEHKAGIE